MFQIFTITSGNRSGGMTPLTVNRGILLALLERETRVLDAGIGMADMALILGMDASRAFKRIAARRSGVGYKEEAGEPAQENFVGRLARAEFI